LDSGQFFECRPLTLSGFKSVYQQNSPPPGGFINQ
jgi:hypothetical protein